MFGANILVLDDFHDGILSQTAVDALWDKYTLEFANRLQGESQLLVVGTDYQPNSFYARLLENDPEIEEIRLPAIAIEDDPLNTVLGRKPGEALWPAVRPLKYLKAMKSDSARVVLNRCISSGQWARAGH